MEPNGDDQKPPGAVGNGRSGEDWLGDVFRDQFGLAGEGRFVDLFLFGLGYEMAFKQETNSPARQSLRAEARQLECSRWSGN